MPQAPTLLRSVLALIGLFIAILGLDVAVGGITTLGWMGPTDFMSISNADDFAVQNNHVQFLGGMFTASGLIFLAGAANPARFRQPVITVCALIFIGGLMRLTAPDISVVANANVIGSFLAELILFPLIALWVWRKT